MVGRGKGQIGEGKGRELAPASLRLSQSSNNARDQVDTPVKARAQLCIPIESLLQVTYDAEEAQTSTTAKAGNKIFYPSQDPQRLGARGDVIE